MIKIDIRDEGARVQVDDHSRSSINRSATVLLPCTLAMGGTDLSFFLFQSARPARAIASIRSSIGAVVGTIRPIGVPHSVITTDSPSLVSLR